ncbi:MAG: hypothetical protein AAGC60_12630 [Acidobacteriota bacterium]
MRSFSPTALAPLFPIALWSLLTWAALASTAWGLAAPLKTAEGRYLALVAAVVVAAAVALAPRVGRMLALVAIGVLWLVPYGPSRAALVTVVLAAGLLLAARDGDVARRLDARRAVALTVGLQVLLRPDLLLLPLLDARTVVSVVALPTVAGLCCAALATRSSARSGLLVLLATALPAPGWNVTVTLSLLAMTLAALGVDLAGRHAAKLLDALRRRGLPLAVLAVLPIVLLGTAYVFGFAQPLALALALVPGAWAAARHDRWLAALGFVLAASGVALRADPEGAAAGLVLLALAAPSSSQGTSSSRSSDDLTLCWLLVCTAPTLLAAAYPWVRAHPLADLVAVLGLGPVAFFGLAAVGLAGTGLVERFDRARRLPFRPTPASLLWIAAALALVVATPGVGQRPLPGGAPATLAEGDARPFEHAGRIELALDGRAVDTISIDTSLVHAPQLEPGRTVATVQLYAGDRRLAEHRVQACRDTADWAASRPDVAGLAGHAAPAARLSHVAPAGTFFGQRYRAVFTSEPIAPTRLVVRLDRDLPPQTRLLVHALDVR